MSQTHANYFGKIPAQGDFIRNQHEHQVIAILDRWADSNMQTLSQMTEWKQRYDVCPGLHFAFLGACSKVILAGHLQPSRDMSGRRFPFMTAVREDVLEPVVVMEHAPVLLAPLWAELSKFSRDLLASDVPQPLLEQLNHKKQEVSSGLQGCLAGVKHFFLTQTLSSIERALNEGRSNAVSLSHMLVGIGLILQPLNIDNTVSVERYMCFPLPRDMLYRPLVSALWMSLLSGFVRRANYEVAIIEKEGDEPILLVGLSGADHQIISAAIAPIYHHEQIIRMEEVEWVAEQLRGDYALAKLASYLDRPDLSLDSAQKIFRETFLGGI
ncbi:type VI secretion system-associated protein TagF [Lysobacteraceae bacterium NML03-0222]|nr:type VI secretion system-associated protein TagF [Xanthomonadaceae bacterium NML03-0222]